MAAGSDVANSCVVVLRPEDLALTLLVARVLANHYDAAVATEHLALVTDLLNAWIDLHRLPSCVLADMIACWISMLPKFSGYGKSVYLYR